MTDVKFYQQLDAIVEAAKMQPELMAAMQHPKYKLDYRSVVRDSRETGKPCLYMECICPEIVGRAPMVSLEVVLDVPVDVLTQDEVFRQYTPIIIKIMKSMSGQLCEALDQNA